jgi:hypothetical protein
VQGSLKRTVQGLQQKMQRRRTRGRRQMGQRVNKKTSRMGRRVAVKTRMTMERRGRKMTAVIWPWPGR